MSFVFCPECGFQNPEAANFCARCGNLLVKPDETETTQTWDPEEEGEEGGGVAVEDVGLKGPALVVRAGGGRTGETFVPESDRTTIGRSPECAIFLDDVTVSRKHAAVVRRDSQFFIEDLGSLNGTFLNKRRIESAPLSDGDELQVGKYRLTFLLK